MNGYGGIGEQERTLAGLWNPGYSGFDFYRESPFSQPSVDVPLGEIYATISAGIIAATQQGAFGVEPGKPGGSPSESVGDQTVVPVIDPSESPTATVFEEEIDDDFVLPHRETDWGEVYDQYVILNPEVPVPVFQEPVPPRDPPWRGEIPGKSQESDVAWSDVFQSGLDIYSSMQTPAIFPQYQYGSGGPGRPASTAPATVTVDTRTGKVTPCRRRRRKPLLTQADYNMILQIAQLPNNQNTRIALAKGVAR